jgi:hypothetical protein
MSAELRDMTASVATVFAGFPEAKRRALLVARDLILAAAAGDPRVGEVTETLKWGEPAYLTKTTRSGSTLRLGLTAGTKAPAMFVNCRTTLVGEIRDRYGDRFRYEGTRGIILPMEIGDQAEAVRHAAHLALTYHLRRRSR